MSKTSKMIGLDGFFQRVVLELKQKTGFNCLAILVPKGRNGGFAAGNSSGRSGIRLTAREIRVIEPELKKMIFCRPADFKGGCFLNKIFLIKIKWKFRLYGVSAVMPIYCGENFLCLILFNGFPAGAGSDENQYRLKKVRQDIAHCFEAILLYNQTLERIIREYGCSGRRPVGCADQLIDG